MSSKIDYNGKLLTVATNLSPPYVFLEKDQNEDKWLLTKGFEVELLKALSEHFNFTYQIINCKSDWGIKLENKSWTGIIGSVYSKKADIGFASLTITNERSEAVFFSNPHIITSVTFITPPPKATPILTLVIEPFETSVWICFMVAFILMLLNEWVISQYYTKLKKHDISWAVISASLRQQFSLSLPSVGPLRLMLCSWLLACLVLTSSYGGCLYSLMAVPSRMKTIDTVMELAEAQTNGRIQVIATESSTYYHLLKHADFGLHRQIGSLTKPVKDKKDGFDKVKNSTKPYAFISTRDHLVDGTLRYGKKSFYLPPPNEDSSVFFAIMAIALQKEFAYRDQFNKFISDIKKGGFLDYWKLLENRKLLKSNPIMDSDEEHEHSSCGNYI